MGRHNRRRHNGDDTYDYLARLAEQLRERPAADVRRTAVPGDDENDCERTIPIAMPLADGHQLADRPVVTR